ncbi:hypothetical protein FRC11_013927, partial [Ceratobasidium sp. 423]
MSVLNTKEYTRIKVLHPASPTYTTSTISTTATTSTTSPTFSQKSHTTSAPEAPKRETFIAPDGEDKLKHCENRLIQFTKAGGDPRIDIDIVSITHPEAEILQASLLNKGFKL